MTRELVCAEFELHISISSSTLIVKIPNKFNYKKYYKKMLKTFFVSDPVQIIDSFA